MHGGTALNMVPDYAEIMFEYRYLAGDSIEQFHQHVTEITQRINEKYQSKNKQAHIIIEEINAYPGFEATKHVKLIR